MTGSACAPTGSLAAPVCAPTICRCGEPITPVPWGADDWSWVDARGRTLISHTEEIAAEYARVRQVMAAGPPGGDVDDPDYVAAIGRYSVMRCAESIGHMEVWHSHGPATGGRALTAPPWCCGQPMQAVPAGWRCRATGTTHGYDDLLGLVQVSASIQTARKAPPVDRCGSNTRSDTSQ